MNEFLLSFCISLIGLIFLFVNATWSFFLRKKITQNSFAFFSNYLISIAIIELFCHVIGVLKPGSNIFISHFYFIFQFIIISAFFISLFKDSREIKKRILKISIVVLILIFTSYMLDFSLFWKFNLFEIGITTSVIFLYVLFYFYKMHEKEKVLYINFLGGLIVYLLSSSLIFLTGNEELVFFKNPYIDIWIFNSFFYILFQVFVFKELHFFSRKE